MKIYKRIIASFLVLLVASSSLVLLLPTKAYALNGPDEAKYDYDLAVASQILIACIVNENISKSDFGKFPLGDNGAKYQASAVWSGSFDTEIEGEVDCNTPKDMRAVLKILGFDSQQSFNEFVTSCNGNSCTLKNDWKTQVWEKAREDKGRPGPDNSTTTTSLAGQYSFWARSFKDGKCSGNVYAQQATYDAKEEDQRVEGPIYWFEGGNVTEKIGAGFRKLEGDEAYQELGPDYFNQENIRLMIAGGAPSDTQLAWYGDSNGGNRYTCADIISKLKDRRYADAMKQLYDERRAAGETGGETLAFTNLFDEEAQNEETCTERALLSAGWIVCSLLEIVSDAITGIFGWVDSILNVDGQYLYENAELRAVWSYFRVVATFALVIIGLIMVISQAIGGGF